MLQKHLQDTYEYLFDAAHRALREGGSFAPFGAGIRKTGEQIHTNVDLAVEKSAPADHISGLIAGFRVDDKENGLMAAGLVFDGQAMSDNERALCFHIEGANGLAVEIIVPYTRLPTQEITFGEPQRSEVFAEVFTDTM